MVKKSNGQFSLYVSKNSIMIFFEKDVETLRGCNNMAIKANKWGCLTEKCKALHESVIEVVL